MFRISIISITFILLQLIFTSQIYAENEKYKQLIKVGPGTGPVAGTIKWSPDGKYLAYFKDHHLYLADSLGHSEQIINIEITPYRFEWLSNYEIVILLEKRLEWIHELYRYATIDIKEKSLSVIIEYDRIGSKIHYKGPYKTIEGNVFFLVKHKEYAKNINERYMELPKSKYNPDTVSLLPENNNFLGFRDDGLYKINGNLKDSVRLGPKPYVHTIARPLLNSDMTYSMAGDAICRLKDSTFTFIDTIVKKDPKYIYGNAVMFHSFNPSAPEVLFNINYSVDGNENHDAMDIGLFNYETNQLMIYYNSEFNLPELDKPVFSPDGKRIVFLGGRNIYILVR